jgi:sulfatase modifying factor 1
MRHALVLLAASARADEPGCGCASSRASLAARDPNAGAWAADPDAGSGSCAAAPGARAAAAADADAPAPPPRVVRLPLGTSMLGTAKGHFPEDAEEPARAWTLAAPLWADAFEVSNARFGAFVAATGYVSEAHAFGWSFVHEDAIDEATKAGISQSVQGAEWWLPVPNASWRHPRGPLQGDALAPALRHHAAVHISKRDGDAFCAWAGGRLPTEDEWEYAARGGANGGAGGGATPKFPWGDTFYARAAPGAEPAHRANIWQGAFPHNNTAGDGFVWTAPVDALGPQNAWGLYNVIGNAWEWTSSRWCPEGQGGAGKGKGRRQPQRALPPDCARRSAQARAREAEDAGEVDYVKKGGSFMCHKSFCYRYRLAARHHNTANSGAQNLGLRCFYTALPPWAEEHVPAP